MKNNKKQIALIIVFIFIAILLVACNILLVFVWINDTNNQTLVATIISGWVSGIATLVVGIIALLQTKKYNLLNDAFLKKQFTLEQCKNIIQNRILFVNNVKAAAEKYMTKCNPGFMELELTNILNNPMGIDNYIKTRRCLTSYFIDLKVATSELLHLIELDYNNCQQRNDVIDSLENFFDKFSSALDTDKKINDASMNVDALISKLMDEIKINDLYANVESSLSAYVVHADMDINEAIFYRNNDIVYLEKMFSPKNEDEHGKD